MLDCKWTEEWQFAICGNIRFFGTNCWTHPNKKQIKVLLFIIISLLYFHSFLYRLSSWYLQHKTYEHIVTLNRCEIGLLFTQASVATTNISIWRFVRDPFKMRQISLHWCCVCTPELYVLESLKFISKILFFLDEILQNKVKKWG